MEENQAAVSGDTYSTTLTLKTFIYQSLYVDAHAIKLAVKVHF